MTRIATPLKAPDQVEASIERFRCRFWERKSGGRPPVGIVPAGAWLPIGYLRKPFTRSHVTPAHVTPALVRSDYEAAAAGRAVFSDDWLPYTAAWRAVPWLEAICGCGVRYAAGSLAPERCVLGADEWHALALPASRAWYDRLQRVTAELAASAAPDCFMSPTILRGPSDVLAAMRGLSDFYLDLHDCPQAIAAAAARVQALCLELLDRHFAVVGPRLGGYGHIFGYWAPGPTHVLQEDVLGMCAPRTYRDIFMPLTAAAVAHLGPYTFFHLHSTGLGHCRDVLGVPGLAGLEITVESNGPSLRDLAPLLRDVLERSRLVLMIDACFDELPDLLRQVPHDGLYLLISDKFIASEGAYRSFVAAHW